MEKLWKKIDWKFLLIILLIALIFTSYKESNVQAQSSSNTSDIQLLARAINGEARGEPYEGQVAVGAVILNRVKDSSFPKHNIRSYISTRSIYRSGADGQINVPQ